MSFPQCFREFADVPLMNPDPNIRWLYIKHCRKSRAKRVNRFNDWDKKFVACLPSLPVSIEYLSVAFFIVKTGEMEI